MAERIVEAGEWPRAPVNGTWLIHEAWAESEKIVDEYRCKLRATERGLDGEKVALRRVQDLVNRVRPQTLLVSDHDHYRHTPILNPEHGLGTHSSSLNRPGRIRPATFKRNDHRDEWRNRERLEKFRRKTHG